MATLEEHVHNVTTDNPFRIFATVDVFDVPLAIMSTAAVLLHSFGVYLLITLHRRGKGSVQRIIICNLSISEVLTSVVCALHGFVKIIFYHHGFEISNIVGVFTFLEANTIF